MDRRTSFMNIQKPQEQASRLSYQNSIRNLFNLPRGNSFSQLSLISQQDMTPTKEVKRVETRRISDVNVTFYHNCNEYEKTLIKNQKACFDSFGNMKLAPLLDQI